MSGAIEDTPGLIASPAADPDGLVALDRAREHLLSLQQPAGWWKGELETNVTMDAEDMLLREFLGIREAGKTARCAAWIRSQQREDGTWSNFAGGPGGPVDDDRVLRRAAARRRRPGAAAHAPRAPSGCAPHGGLAAGARVHPHLDGAVRRLGLGPGAGAAAGDDPAAAVVPAQRLRLRLLGAADGRRAVGRARVAPGPASCRSRSTSCTAPSRGQPPKARTLIAHAVRRARSRAAGLPAPPDRAAAPVRAAQGRALDRRPPGGRRRLGRDPAALGLLADRAAPARLSRSITR